MIFAAHDFETYSTVDLRKANADVYAQHPSTGIHCLAWAIGDGPVNLWQPGDPDPKPLLEHIKAGEMLSAWNSYFEESIWRYVIARICPHWPIPTTEQFDDTMARALASSLPASLDECAKATGLGIYKDDAGSRVMKQLAKPRKVEKDGTVLWWTKEDNPDKFQTLYDYCVQDVETERAQAKVLRALSPNERKLWLVDQAINRRGIGVDIQAVRNAINLIERETARLNAAMSKATQGAVPTVTSLPKLKQWVIDQGCDVDKLDKPAIRELLSDASTPKNVQKALRIRLEAGKASVAKLRKMLTCAANGDRLTSEFGYHIATTGRWGGRGVQLQNLVRPKLDASEIADCIDALGSDIDADYMRWVYGSEPFDVISWSLRGMLVPKKGHRFLGGDFSNIEGRTIAWLAGEDWKIRAFEDVDTGHGHDLYRLAYGRAFGVDPGTVNDDQRQLGKVMELALGYQGGVGAFRTMASGYGTDLNIMAKQVRDASDAETWTRAEEKRQWLQIEKKQHPDLPANVYNACRVLVDAWREANFAIKTFWADIEMAAMTAIAHRGDPTETNNGLIKFVCGKDFLYCKLPSGRILSYARPSIELVYSDLFETYQKTIQYYATGKDRNGADNSAKRGFNAIHSYGGLLAQNATQAVARDILAEAILRLESAGYPVVLHVHDEARAEVPNDFGSVADVTRIMSEVPTWAHGLPISVGCEEMARYHK